MLAIASSLKVATLDPPAAGSGVAALLPSGFRSTRATAPVLPVASSGVNPSLPNNCTPNAEPTIGAMRMLLAFSGSETAAPLNTRSKLMLDPKVTR